MTFRIPFSYYKLKAVGTKVHPFGTSIRAFELSFLISVPINDRETDLLNLPFIIFFSIFRSPVILENKYPKS